MDFVEKNGLKEVTVEEMHELLDKKKKEEKLDPPALSKSKLKELEDMARVYGF
ncbi:MAG: hypothetical protein ABIG60_01230 [Patescibacteria group bacterium]